MSGISVSKVLLNYNTITDKRGIRYNTGGVGGMGNKYLWKVQVMAVMSTIIHIYVISNYSFNHADIIWTWLFLHFSVMKRVLELTFRSNLQVLSQLWLLILELVETLPWVVSGVATNLWMWESNSQTRIQNIIIYFDYKCK